MSTAPVTLRVRRRTDDLETPVSALLKLGPQRPGAVLFESVLDCQHVGRYAAIGLDPDLWWRVRAGLAQTSDRPAFDVVSRSSRDPVADMRRFVALCRTETSKDLPALASGAFGFVGRGLFDHLERLPRIDPAARTQPDAMLVRPRAMLVFDAVRREIVLAAPVREGIGEAEARLDALEARLDAPLETSARPHRPAQEIDFQPDTAPERFFELVEIARNHMRRGDAWRVAPSVRFTTRYDASLFEYYRALRRIAPAPFMFYLDFGGLGMAGAAPEMLARVRGRHAAVAPMSGWRSRGSTGEQDRLLELRLLRDEADRAEHLTLIDVARNDLGRVAEPGSVRVLRSFVAERYSDAMHIVSHVEGRLRRGADAVDTLTACFPPASVSGVPKIRAVGIAAGLGADWRGPHGGGVGYFCANGDMEWCAARRAAVLADGQLTLASGGGVTINTDPATAWRDCLDAIALPRRAAGQAARHQTTDIGARAS